MKKIIKYIKQKAKFFDSPIHGIKHWQNVEKIGMYLCERNGADEDVIRIFAYIHDVGRLNEDADLQHGKRSAEILENLIKSENIGLNRNQSQQLHYACEHHSEEDADSDDVTIQTCWDADRLDLWRFGIVPERELLFTNAAKTTEASEYAKNIQNSR